MILELNIDPNLENNESILSIFISKGKFLMTILASVLNS